MHGTLPKVDKQKVAKAPPFVVHYSLPGIEIVRAQARPRETIAKFIEREAWNFKLPTICVINGEPVLRSNWRKVRIKSGDLVSFVSRPGKGGGGKTFGLIAMIALAAFAFWAVPGLLGGATLIGLTAAQTASLAGALVMLGGGFLINALLFPHAGGLGEGSTDQIKQLFSIGASGNTATPLSPIPVQYGKWKDFPPYAAQPWTENIGNDQYLNLLLCVGCGKYQVAALYIDDTVLWTLADGFSSEFTDVQQAKYGPGEPVTLFPVNVVSAAEVSGQQLLDPATEPNDGWIGGFIASAAGTQANAIAVDLVFPLGVWYNDVNGYHTGSVPVEAEYRSVNDAGTPLSDYVTLFSQTFTYNSRQPIRETIKTAVSPGRYQVRVRRTNRPHTGDTHDNGGGGQSSEADDVVWGALRAFIEGPSSFAGVTTQAIRIKATSQVSQSSSKKFGVLRTRILPVWDGDSWVDTVTRSPAWAFYDSVTDTDYGAKRPVGKTDFQAIVDLDTRCTSRGDTFDYVFSTSVTIPEAWDTILKVCRTRHRWAGDTVSLVTDKFRSVPQMLLTDRETVRGSLNIDWTFNSEDQADCVILEYVDEDTWGASQVQYPPNSESFTATTPVSLRLPGIINRAQAFREAAFWYLQSYYRRINVMLDTEHDGRLLSFGSAVSVQTELPQTWGATGIISLVSGTTLTLDPAPDWSDDGTHYILIRSKTGKPFGPIICTQGANAALAILDNADLAAVQTAQSMTLAQAIDRATGAEDPTFAFGIATKSAKNCVVVSGRPNGDKVTLSLFVDDERVHSDVLGDVPIAPDPSPLTDNPAPVIIGLIAVFRQGTAEPILDASWAPASGAQTYDAQISFDDGSHWTSIYRGTINNFSRVVDRAALKLRVAGIGNKHGAYSSIDVEAPTIVIAPRTVDINSLNYQLDQHITTQRAEIDDLLKKAQDLIASLSAEQDAANWIDKRGTRTAITASFASSYAAIIDVSAVMAAADSALAVRATNLETSVNDPTTGLATRASASDVTALESLTGDATHGNLALATRATNLETDVNDPTTGLATRASASDVTALESLTGDATHGNLALAARTISVEANLNGPASSGTATVTIASPAVVSRTAHGLTAGRRFKWSTTGELPTGITEGADYYVIATGLTANAFEFSATFGGSAVNTSGSQSGTHTIIAGDLASGLQEVSASGQFRAVASAGSGGALAVIDMEVSAKVGATFASAGVQMAALVDLDGNPYSLLLLHALSTQIAIPGVDGGDPFQPFIVDYVNGVKQIALRPDAIPDGAVKIRTLEQGILGTISSAVGSDVTKTQTQWNNSGTGDIVLSVTLSTSPGSSLLIDFNTQVYAAAGNSYTTGFVKLKVNGSLVKSYQPPNIGTAVAQKWAVPFPINQVVNDLPGGDTTVEVSMYFDGTSSTNITAIAPQFILREIASPIVADVSTAITPSYSYRTSLVGGSGGTSGSFTAVDIGSADPYRVVAVMVAWSSSVNTPTMTIGGVAATRDTSIQDWWGQQRVMALFVARVPTGTTADIVFSVAGSPQDINIHVWKIVSASVSPSHNYGYTTGGSPGTVVMTPISVTAGEMLIGACYGSVDGGATFSGTWSGSETITERADDVAVTGRYGAYDLAVTATGARTLSMASSSGAAQAIVGIAARWR